MNTETKEDSVFLFVFFWGGAGGRINSWETWGWLDLTFVVSLIVNEGCARLAALQCLKSILESSSSLWPRIQHNPIESSNVFCPTQRLDVKTRCSYQLAQQEVCSHTVSWIC